MQSEIFLLTLSHLHDYIALPYTTVATYHITSGDRWQCWNEASIVGFSFACETLWSEYKRKTKYCDGCGSSCVPVPD